MRPDGPLIVTGNPNVGKGVVFQLLTGRYTTVSNYPGTMVMVTRGSASLDGQRFSVYDTPGIGSLQASSEDELVARDLLLREPATVVQVADAKNLLRALTLTLELAEGRNIQLSPAGLPRAQEVVRRHRLTEVLLHNVLQVSEASMESTACQVEHILTALGLAPGRGIRLRQRTPALVVQLGETELALDRHAGEEIFVRRHPRQMVE